MKINTKSIFKTALGVAAALLFSNQTSAQCSPPSTIAVISDITSTTITATWGASSGQVPNGQYQWQVRLPGEGQPGDIGAVQSGLTDNDVLTDYVATLDFSTDYVFYVSYRCDDLGTANSQSIWLATTFSTLTLTDPVATAATDVQSEGFRINWDFLPGADGYKVDLSSSADFSTFVSPEFENQDVIPGTTVFLDVTGLLTNTEYWYRVSAYGTNVEGEYYATGESNTIRVRTLGPPSDFYTWTAPGEWLPAIGSPDNTKDLIINFDYDMTAINPLTNVENESFEGKSLKINDGYTLTIADGKYIDIRNNIENLNSNNDGLIVENGGNILQKFTGVNTNMGGMKLERESAKIYRLDYTIWSSPTSDPVGGAVTQSLLDFSPQTVTTRFYSYDTSTDFFVAYADPATEFFEPGRGYLIRASNYHPSFVNTSTAGTKWLGTFEGPINAGLYEVPLELTGDRFNMVGNPYPSQLSLDVFIDENLNLTGAIYLWRRRNAQNGDNNTLSAYYATYTVAGGTQVGSPVAEPSFTSDEPSAYIQPGQGFIVQAASATGPQTIKFRNDMRSSDDPNAPFFRGASTVVEKNRFWLNVSNATQIFNQMLVAYMPNAVNGIDRADGKFFGEASVALTSFLDNEEYTIQARAPFTNADVVPLHFRTPVADTYTINFDHADGMFDTTQDIYLKDNLTNITHDIKAAPYTFATEAGTFANRFEIVYSSPLTVGDVVLDANAIAVVKQNGMIVINSGSVTMSNVKIFDIRGRLIAQKNNVNASETSINAGAENQVLIVQIVSDNGATVSKKFVN